MQKTVYRCDWCSEDIKERKHISIRFAVNSGIYKFTELTKKLEVLVDLQQKFMHFCDSKCLGAYFSNLMKQKK